MMDPNAWAILLPRQSASWLVFVPEFIRRCGLYRLLLLCALIVVEAKEHVIARILQKKPLHLGVGETTSDSRFRVAGLELLGVEVKLELEVIVLHLKHLLADGPICL